MPFILGFRDITFLLVPFIVVYLALTLPNSMFSLDHLLFFWILEFRYVLGRSTYMNSLQ